MKRKERALLPIVSGALLICLLTGARACDTWVAMSDVTENGYVMLGKNSDRSPFGCQPLVFNARQEWPAGSEIDLGRLSVPQVELTYATLGSSPYWCWGYEEGLNEFGVAIGNEGVSTKPLSEGIAAYARRDSFQLGPTGMDLLRLGLERGRTAREALEVMTGLLEEYGQFGSGIPTADALGSYDNSYLIADPREAYILETAGRRWAAKRVAAGSASISNRLSIGTGWDLASPDLVEHAVEKGWWDKGATSEFDFRVAYAGDTPDLVARDERARVRQERSCSLLLAGHGALSVGSMKEIARDQSSDPSIDLDQTASSCVAVLPAGGSAIPVFWWCASRPSNGCFVPFFVHGSSLPTPVSTAGTFGKRVVPPSEARADEFSPDSYWWLFRDLTDMVSADRQVRQLAVREVFDQLEAEFEAGLDEALEEAEGLRASGDEAGAARVLDAYTTACVERATTKVNDLREQFAYEDVEIPSRFRPYLGTYLGNFGQFQNAEFEVTMQNDRLAVDVPGQMVFELLEPDEQGLWYFALTPLVTVSFKEDGTGGITALVFNQASELTRDAAADSGAFGTATAGESGEGGLEVPQQYRPYLGKYVVPPGLAEMNVYYVDGNLILEIPSQQATIELLSPDDRGWWYFAGDDAAAISFVEDESGNVTKLLLHQRFELPRKSD